MLEDAATGGRIVYRITRPGPATLVLTGPSGTSLLLRAPGGAAGTPGAGPPDEVLATAGEPRLTTADLQVAFDLVELVTDEPMTGRSANDCVARRCR